MRRCSLSRDAHMEHTLNIDTAFPHRSHNLCVNGGTKHRARNADRPHKHADVCNACKPSRSVHSLGVHVRPHCGRHSPVQKFCPPIKQIHHQAQGMRCLLTLLSTRHPARVCKNAHGRSPAWAAQRRQPRCTGDAACCRCSSALNAAGTLASLSQLDAGACRATWAILPAAHACWALLASQTRPARARRARRRPRAGRRGGLRSACSPAPADPGSR